MNLVSSLAESCDVFFYKISTELGIDKIATMARKLGLGKQYGFDLLEERSGLVPDKNWKRGYFGQSWQPGETVVASIGQGYLLSTPLQLAVMTSRLVNGGKVVKPWLSANSDIRKHNTSQSIETLNVKEQHLKLILEGMNMTVNGQHGTARGSRITEPGMVMGGKTGTAQVKRITRAQRQAGVKNEDLTWKHRHHALFVGYAPIHDPRYVVSVVVEHGVSGSGSAAPLARDILLEAQRRAPAKTPLFNAENANVQKNHSNGVSKNG
jgi:penicillin-binding protein 2